MTPAHPFQHPAARAVLAAACALAAACPLPAAALTERLDDSASPRSRVSMPLQWSANADASLATAQGRVEFRLATARYAGRPARVYLVMPLLVPGLLNPAALQVEWRGQGLLGPGKARPGERVLVWSGVVAGPWLADTLELRLQLDPRSVRLQQGMNFGFEPYFEIEVTP